MQPIDFERFYIASTQLKSWTDTLVVEGQNVVPGSPKKRDNATWGIFQHAVKQGLTTRQLKRLNKRYGIDLSVKKQKVTKLMIETVCTCTAVVNKKDLPSVTYRNYRSAQHFAFADQHNLSLDRVRAGPDLTHEYLQRDPFFQDKKLTTLFRGIENLTQEGFEERLAMAINGHEMEIGTLIPAPGRKKGEVVFLEKYGSYGKKGLRLDAFKPVGKNNPHPPTIVLRGTQSSLSAVDALYTIMNNAAPENGKLGFDASVDDIEELLQDIEFTGGNLIRALGFSLGCCHLGFIIAHYWYFFSKACFYRTVHTPKGVDKILAKQINALPAAFPRPSLYIERAKGDIASNLGERHVGYGANLPVYLREVNFGSHPTSATGWTDLHGKRRESNPGQWTAEWVSPADFKVELDNRRRKEAREYEKMRRGIMTQIFYHIVDFFHRLLHFILRFYGIELIRTTDQDG